MLPLGRFGHAKSGLIKQRQRQSQQSILGNDVFSCNSDLTLTFRLRLWRLWRQRFSSVFTKQRPCALYVAQQRATLGLPQINPINEQIKQRMEDSFGRGYDYTYLYPGLQKVVQAAGRVIRTESDRGVVYLIDDRFAQDKVRGLFPSWWRVEVVRVRLGHAN